jgi:O-antigen/teichoic acid export membrane protein
MSGLDEALPASAPSPAGRPEPVDTASAAESRVLAKNALKLVVSQFVTTPLALVANGVMGRYLGPSDFGLIYLLSTVIGFVFLLLEWGQGGSVTAAIAGKRTRTGELLASMLAVRLPLCVVFYFVGAAALRIFGYPETFQFPFLLMFVNAAVQTVTGSIGVALRGHERISSLVSLNVASAVFTAVVPVGALILGFGFTGWLWTNIVVSVLAFGVAAWLVRDVDPGPLTVSAKVAADLVRTGSSFLVLIAVLALQPYIDAIFLSRLAPPEVMGWYAAARKIQNVILFPSTSLAVALFPTLMRLHNDSKQAWAALTATACELVALCSVPAALGCLLYADVGVALFNKERFGPAADNLRVLSGFVFFVYFNITIGTALQAARREKAWAAAQALCVLVSAAADPLLIPYFQRRYGNGGLGVGVSTVVSEVLMMAAAFRLLPKGALQGRLAVAVGRAMLAGVAMAAVALVLRSAPWPASMAASLCAYGVALALLGGVGDQSRELFRDVVVAKLRRR